MKALHICLVSSILAGPFLFSPYVASSAIILDQSPATAGGTRSAGVFNQSDSQNWGELITLTQTTSLTGMDIYEDIRVPPIATVGDDSRLGRCVRHARRFVVRTCRVGLDRRQQWDWRVREHKPCTCRYSIASLIKSGSLLDWNVRNGIQFAHIQHLEWRCPGIGSQNGANDRRRCFCPVS